MAIGLLRAQQDQRLKILPPSFGLVVRGVWGGREGWDEIIALCSILLVSLIMAVFPSLKMITWPFLMPLQSDHLCCFRTEWGTFLQSSWKKWSLEPGVADLCLRSQQQSKVSHGWRNARLGEVSTGMPWFPWSSAESSSLMTSLPHLWKVLVLPRPKSHLWLHQLQGDRA